MIANQIQREVVRSVGAYCAFSEPGAQGAGGTSPLSSSRADSSGAPVMSGRTNEDAELYDNRYEAERSSWTKVWGDILDGSGQHPVMIKVSRRGRVVVGAQTRVWARSTRSAVGKEARTRRHSCRWLHHTRSRSAASRSSRTTRTPQCRCT